MTNLQEKVVDLKLDGESTPEKSKTKVSGGINAKGA
jgi:hypothetical protein